MKHHEKPKSTRKRKYMRKISERDPRRNWLRNQKRKLPEERELLDKCDGLATAAGTTEVLCTVYTWYHVESSILQWCIRIHLGAAFLTYSRGGLSSAWNCPPRTEKSCTHLLRTGQSLYKFAAYHSNPVQICCVPLKSYTDLLRTTEIL